jgi:tRNA/rRNA methyltransferase
MPYSVILVNPKYDENVGSVARAMKNFGLKDLRLVNPEADWKGGKARSRAMHGQDLLKKAKVFTSLEKALKGVEVAAATTAKTTRQSNVFRSPLSPQEFFGAHSSQEKIALVFGSEPNGLNNEEIRICDVLISIPCHRAYPTLNLAMSAGVLFYEAFKQASQTTKHKTAGENIRRQVLKTFKELIESDPRIKNKKDSFSACKGLLGKSLVTEKEAKAVLTALKASAKK